MYLCHESWYDSKKYGSLILFSLTQFQKVFRRSRNDSIVQLEHHSLITTTLTKTHIEIHSHTSLLLLYD